MKDWLETIDDYLKMTRRDILTTKGRVTHKQALEKAHGEYKKYRKRQEDILSPVVECHFLESIEELQELEDKNNFCRGLDIRVAHIIDMYKRDSSLFSPISPYQAFGEGECPVRRLYTVYFMGIVLYFLHNGFRHGNGAYAVVGFGWRHNIAACLVLYRDLVIFMVLSLKLKSASVRARSSPKRIPE